MDDILKTQFEADLFILRRLANSDAKFASICVDYRDAVAARRHWTEQSALDREKGLQYAAIEAELRAEIEMEIRREKARLR